MDGSRTSIGKRAAGCALAALLAAVGCSSGSSDSSGETEPPVDGGADAGTGGPAGDVSSSGGGLSVVEGVTGSQLSTGAPGLTVRRVVTAKAPADRAVVVVVPETDFGPTGPEAVSTEDRRKIVEALGAIDIGGEAVDFGFGRGFAGARVAVTIPVGEVGARGPQIVEAVEGVVGRAQQSGVTFSLADCGPVLAGLRKQAFADAEAEARSWAESTPARPGPVVAVSSTTESAGSAGVGRADPCRPGETEPVRNASVQPLDAPAEVEVSLQLAVTYALGTSPAPADASQVSAVGTGTAKAKADEAYVLVVAGYDEEGDSQPVSRKDRDRLVTAVAGLGHDRKDIQVTSAPDDPGVTLVQVEVEVGDVEKAGRPIVNAVEEVLGRSDTSGVRFGREDCPSLLARARKDAAADGRTRAAALAESAGVRVGDLRGVTDLGSPSGVPPCSDDAEDLFVGSDFEYGYGPSLEPFDAEPTFELTTRIALSYSLAR